MINADGEEGRRGVGEEGRLKTSLQHSKEKRETEDEINFAYFVIATAMS